MRGNVQSMAVVFDADQSTVESIVHSANNQLGGGGSCE